MKWKLRFAGLSVIFSFLVSVGISSFAGAQAKTDPVSPERVASIGDRLKEEERWGTFIQDMFGWTQPAKCLTWPKAVQDRLVGFQVRVSSLQAKLGAFSNSDDKVAEVEAGMSELTAERLSLIREVYSDVLKVKNSGPVDRLFGDDGVKVPAR